MISATFLAVALSVVVTVDGFEFQSDESADRYASLITEFRCPKCLNINLAGSDAPIAQDLRRAVYRLVNEGKSNQEIRDYMRERYGDFILYNPRLTPQTLALWLSPLILVLFASWLVLHFKDRRTPLTLTPDEIERLQELRK